MLPSRLKIVVIQVDSERIKCVNSKKEELTGEYP